MEHQMLVILASTMSKEQILTRLQESINDYNEAKLLNNSENLNKANTSVLLSCHLFILNQITDGKIEGSMEVIKKMETMKKRDEIFNLNKS